MNQDKYKIKIDYQTGDSFGSSDESQYIELGWNDLESAKESLKRIKNHYEYVLENDYYNKPESDLPEGVIWNNNYNILQLELITDDKEPYIYHSFWTGYFERLYKAEIICDNSDMVYRPKGYY